MACCGKAPPLNEADSDTEKWRVAGQQRRRRIDGWNDPEFFPPRLDRGLLIDGNESCALRAMQGTRQALRAMAVWPHSGQGELGGRFCRE